MLQATPSTFLAPAFGCAARSSRTRDTPSAYIDWCQQEFGIAAILSGDEAMIAAYLSGDPYLEFAKQAGAAPPDATKATHGAVRELFKACVLGVQYGMGPLSLARRIGQPPIVGRDLMRAHHETYRKYWAWSDAAVDTAMLGKPLQTVFGWPIHVVGDANPRSMTKSPNAGQRGRIVAPCVLLRDRTKASKSAHPYTTPC